MAKMVPHPTKTTHPPGPSPKPSPPRNARPFLKWAGGKQQLLAQLEPYFPPAFDRYLEPFVGGGAVFFHLWNAGRLPVRVSLFDTNEEIVNTYTAVRDHLDELVEQLAVHKARHGEEYYYHIRAQDRRPTRLSDVQRAARTIYLNRTCFNGLYRVNSKGQFNVPLGRYRNPAIVRRDVLQAASEALRNVDIQVKGFHQMVDLARPSDFYYFDPPYDPVSKTAHFTGYTSSAFGEQDQRDLADVFAQLAQQGCLCMLSNSHTPFILDLYRDYRIETVYAKRIVNSDVSGRGRVKEVVIMNYG
jgi:DNA adenine methylase